MPKVAIAKRTPTVSQVLQRLESSVVTKAEYTMREGFFRGILKSAFVKSFEFAQLANRIKSKDAGEEAFFMAAALRGICEDLIALKFISQLPRRLRDEVIVIEMSEALRKSASEQTTFFKEQRPFQPVLTFRPSAEAIESRKQRLTEIGKTSGLWKTEGKLPPIEQMATRVKLRAVYNYIYRITSDTVHFNPRIALRQGWGNDSTRFKFSAKNFCGYYLSFDQVYGAFLFVLLCKAFRKHLRLQSAFMDQVTTLTKALDDVWRWPEAVTYEEMNQPDPGPILRSALKVIHDDKVGKREAGKVIRAIHELGSK